MLHLRPCLSVTPYPGGLPRFKPGGYFVQFVVQRTALGALLLGRQHYVGYLHRWRLTRQRQQLIHGNTGSDDGVTTPMLCRSYAQRLLHQSRQYSTLNRRDSFYALLSPHAHASQ